MPANNNAIEVLDGFVKQGNVVLMTYAYDALGPSGLRFEGTLDTENVIEGDGGGGGDSGPRGFFAAVWDYFNPDSPAERVAEKRINALHKELYKDYKEGRGPNHYYDPRVSVYREKYREASGQLFPYHCKYSDPQVVDTSNPPTGFFRCENFGPGGNIEGIITSVGGGRAGRRGARGGANPIVLAAARPGSTLHSDRPGNLPDQLRQRYPETQFAFKKPGEPGQDVQVVGGNHPSGYPGSTWPQGVDYGDFKPGTIGGQKTFDSDQLNKWPDPTFMLPYDPPTGLLR